jgi:hypothetical protein
MSTTRTGFLEQNAMLVREFDKYIIEYPEFAEKIPDDALVVMQVKGDDEFNGWARLAAKTAAEKGKPVVFVTVTEMKPVRSRIQRLELEVAA